MHKVGFSMFLLLLLAVALAVPVLGPAQDNRSQDGAPTVFSYPASRTQAPPIVITVIGFTNASAGMQINGFPCMGGTTGCADPVAGTLALSAPKAVIMKGSKVTYTFEFEDVSYTGPCSLSFTLTDGATKMDSGQYTFPKGCVPNTVYFAAFNRTLKSNRKLGIAALNGSLKAGAHKDTIVQKFCFM